MTVSAGSDYNQYLCFTLAGEVYAFRVMNVREVIFMTRFTPLPSTYDFLPGVINLRGSVIPLIDLRKKLRFEGTAPTEETSIVILERSNDAQTSLIGAIVDSVRGVVFFPDLSIEPPPGFGMRIDPTVVRGFSNRNETLVVILDAEKFFAPEVFRTVKGREGA